MIFLGPSDLVDPFRRGSTYVYVWSPPCRPSEWCLLFTGCNDDTRPLLPDWRREASRCPSGTHAETVRPVAPWSSQKVLQTLVFETTKIPTFWSTILVENLRWQRNPNRLNSSRDERDTKEKKMNIFKNLFSHVKKNKLTFFVICVVSFGKWNHLRNCDLIYPSLVILIQLIYS